MTFLIGELCQPIGDEMKKSEQKKLTKAEESKIKEAIEDRLDNLEDTVNDNLKSILEDIGLKDNQEALLYARELFYMG